MGLLDKLKAQPRWKHADPTVRLEAVRDLTEEAELAALAESDPDIRIRRAAVVRLVSPDVLGRLLRDDPDSDVRDKAADRLMALASRGADPAEEGGSAELSIRAVREIADQRRLSTIAKSDAPEAVRLEALSHVTDVRALSGIARQSTHESTAAAALAKVSGPDELLDVVLHAEHREVASQAFDRMAPSADLDLLRLIEERSQQKSVSRKARTMIQELERETAARAAALEERRRRESSLCDAMEQVASVGDQTVARAEFARIDETWRALDVTDEDVVQRFGRAAEAAQAAIARRQREADEAAELFRLRAETIATRDALCARVETLDGDDVLEQLVPIEEEWRSIPPIVSNGAEADRLAERFAHAVAACRKRHELGAAVAEARTRLEALVGDAETLPGLEDVTAASERCRVLSREARDLVIVLTGASRPADDLTARLRVVEETVAAREADRRRAADAAIEKAREDALGTLRRLAERAKRVADAEIVTLREGDRLMRDIKTGLDSVSAVPSSREIEEAERRLRSLQETVAPRVRELREMDEWRRFANAQRQEQLIAMAEAIVASLKVDVEAGRESDLAATAKALRELHAQWHDVAEAPRQNAQRLWDRFRTATDFIRTRCEVHFAKLRAEREAATARRAEIVAEAEAIATSTDWTRAAVRFQELQTAWKELGPVNHEAGRTLMQQFRTAGNTFFARRREDLADRRKEWSENFAAKEALCERAEALTESTEWEAAAAEMKRLQVAWKAIGPVRRNKSEAIWGRFRGAADRFFERFHHRHEIMLSAKLAEREAMVVELEELAGADAPVAEGFAERVRTLRTTWTRSVQIPVPGMKVLTDRWQQALTRAVEQHPAAFAGTDLDPAAVVDRMEKVVRRVEALLDRVPAPSAGLSQAELLAAKLRSALASNAMGGRASEDAKWRAAADTVRDAQSTWQRLAPTTAPEARGLEQRFREACRRVLDEARRHGHGQAPAHGTHGDRKPQPRNDHRPRASRMPAPKPHPEPVGAR